MIQRLSLLHCVIDNLPPIRSQLICNLQISPSSYYLNYNTAQPISKCTFVPNRDGVPFHSYTIIHTHIITYLQEQGESEHIARTNHWRCQNPYLRSPRESLRDRGGVNTVSRIHGAATGCASGAVERGKKCDREKIIARHTKIYRSRHCGSGTLKGVYKIPAQHFRAGTKP